jgi:nucleotide-binding universal stress UspA family protein
LGFNLQINIEKIFGTGEAKYVICNAAKNLEADTLVMGSHGYGFFKRYQIHQLFNIFKKIIYIPNDILFQKCD